MEEEERNNSQMKISTTANHYLCSGVRTAFISGAIHSVSEEFVKI